MLFPLAVTTFNRRPFLLRALLQRLLMLLCTIYYDDDSFQDWTGNQFARGPNEFFLKPDTGGLGVLVGPGIVVHDLPVARLLLRRSMLGFEIVNRSRSKASSARLPSCTTALGHRSLPWRIGNRGFGYNYHIRLQPKRVVQFLAQQHTRLCDASDAAPEASFPLALVQSSLPPLSAASFGAP